MSEKDLKRIRNVVADSERHVLSGSTPPTMPFRLPVSQPVNSIFRVVKATSSVTPRSTTTLGTGTVEIYNSTSGTLVPSGTTVPVFNTRACAPGASDYWVARRDNDTWYMVHPTDCAPATTTYSARVLGCFSLGQASQTCTIYNGVTAIDTAVTDSSGYLYYEYSVGSSLSFKATHTGYTGTLAGTMNGSSYTFALATGYRCTNPSTQCGPVKWLGSTVNGRFSTLTITSSSQNSFVDGVVTNQYTYTPGFTSSGWTLLIVFNGTLTHANIAATAPSTCNPSQIVWNTSGTAYAANTGKNSLTWNEGP